MSQEPENNRASRMLNDLLSEGLEQGSGTRPVMLPRMRIVMTGAAAPVSVTRKKQEGAPSRPASEMLPEILKEVDEARRKARESRTRELKGRDLAASAASPEAPTLPAPVQGQALSRLRRRYALSFGKRPEELFRSHKQESGGALIEAAIEDKAIYQTREDQRRLSPAEAWWEQPKVASWVFLLPGLLVFLFFAWMPMIRGLLLSFQRVSLVGDSEYIGIDNYVRAFSDPLFWNTIWHALYLCALSLAVGFWIPIVLAIIINELRFGRGWLRLAFFLPFLTPTVPAVILWRWIFDQGFGVLNTLIAGLGFSDPHVPWLNNPWLAMLSVVAVFLWKNTGWNALIYNAALREVPEELYEAAELDGASVLTRIRKVSLPALRPTMMVLLIMQVINSFQIFTEVFLLTQGGPMSSTEVIATYLYKKSFLYLDIGYASALAVVLFLVLLTFTGLRMKTIEREA